MSSLINQLLGYDLWGPSENTTGAMSYFEQLRHTRELEEFAELVLKTTTNETLKWNARRVLNKGGNDEKTTTVAKCR